MNQIDRRSFLATTAAAGLATAAPAWAQAVDPKVAAHSKALTTFLDAQYEEEVQMDPEELTSQGRKVHYDKLTDRSEAAADRQLAWRRQSVAKMKAQFDPRQLDEAGRTSFDMWALELERSQIRSQWRRHRYVFARGSAHVGLPNFLINFHRVDEPADLTAYVARIGRIDEALDQLLVRAKAGAADGVRMPRFDYKQGLADVQRVTKGAPFTEGPDSPLFADFKKKTEALRAAGKIDQAQADGFVKAASEAMTGQVKPAYDRVTAWLTEDMAKTPELAAGAHALPNGRAYYAAMLKIQTTTDMTADQIHDLGLSEVARIRGEMETLKTSVGFKGTLPEFFVFMRTDKQFYLPNTDEGRAEYLQRAEAFLTEMKRKMPAYFGILPKADLQVKRVESFREIPGAAQHYFSGTPDGTRPGIYYSHLSDMNAMPTYQLQNIAYHEGLPGHHMQISIAQELTGLPKFRTQYGYTAFSEGWGLYAEALPKEMGLYTDPYNDFGRLSGEIWRAIRLVVDTGIHHKAWSEEQAVAYFMANSAQPEAAIRAEIQRYFLNPGQATCYKIGMLKLQSLRDESRRALGAKFDYRQFHDVVLGGGSLPLPVAEGNVKRWLARQKAA